MVDEQTESVPKTPIATAFTTSVPLTVLLAVVCLASGFVMGYLTGQGERFGSVGRMSDLSGYGMYGDDDNMKEAAYAAQMLKMASFGLELEYLEKALESVRKLKGIPRLWLIESNLVNIIAELPKADQYKRAEFSHILWEHHLDLKMGGRGR